MKYSLGVIGNSSSGILEAPSFKIPSINIGNRQDGRLQSLSTINCKGNVYQILKALKRMTSKNFLKVVKKTKNIYYKKNTEIKIVSTIENKDLEKLNKKKFYEKN